MHVRYSPEAIKQAMRIKNLSPRDIDRRSNGRITHTSVYALMKGQYKKSQYSKLEALARVLRVPVEDLLAN